MSEADGHAGVLETSLALARFDPRLVREFAGVEGYTDAEPGWEERMMAEGIDALTPTGILGDPAGSSAEFGDAIFEALTAELASWMTRELDMAVG